MPISDLPFAALTELAALLGAASGRDAEAIRERLRYMGIPRTQLLVDRLGYVDLAPDVAAQLTHRAGALSARIRIFPPV